MSEKLTWSEFAAIVQALQRAGWVPVEDDRDWCLAFRHSAGRIQLVPIP